MADHGVALRRPARMKQKPVFGRKILAKSLLDLCVTQTVTNLPLLMSGLGSLPGSLKARILHLMSKRSNLITDENLATLATQWTNELDFTNSSVSDAGLLKLSPLPRLYKLDLNDTRTGTRDNVTSQAISHLAESCPGLRIVYLRRCVNVCDRGVEALARRCRFLLELNVSGCTRVTDASVKVVAEECGHLTNLNLAYTSITDDSAYRLAAGVCSDKLQELQVSHCQSLTDEGVEALLHGLCHVSYLEIQGCPLVTDRSIVALEELREKFDLKQFNFTIPL